MSHRGNQQVAHAEAALGAGRPYEKSNEGHNAMFNDMKELEKHNAQEYGHPAGKQSRGERIDQELDQEDKATVERMNQSHQQKEESSQSKHSKD
jgi:hypothetical protein